MDKCQLIDIPSDPEKKREWIKYKLKIQGLSLAALGRKHKTSRQVVSTALYKPSPRWEHEIATALGEPPRKSWRLNFLRKR
ncbi:helix-turn-helix domain-containing protein [Salmonella enterica]